MIAKILTPLDGTPAAEAGLTWAEYAARRCGAAIQLYTVLEREDANGRLEQAGSYLRGHTESLLATGLAADFEVATGPAADCILAKAEAADLAVMTYGTSRWLFGGVMDRLLHQMTGPMVIVRAVPGHAFSLPVTEKLLLPLDGSSHASDILPVAQKLAKALGASIVLCHIVAPLGYYRNAADAPPGVAHAMESLLEEARQFLAQTARQLEDRDTSVETVVAVGEAPHEIIRIAGHCGAGLIAMATRGSDRLSRVMGSVAYGVVQSTRLPCLLTRSGDRE